MNLKLIFGMLVVAFLFLVGFQVVPIVYKGYIALPGICTDNVEMYLKYGDLYVLQGVRGKMDTLNMPKQKREIYFEKDDENVYLTLIYYDTANWFDRYQKDFYFEVECDAPRKSLFHQRN